MDVKGRFEFVKAFSRLSELLMFTLDPLMGSCLMAAAHLQGSIVTSGASISDQEFEIESSFLRYFE